MPAAETSAGPTEARGPAVLGWREVSQIVCRVVRLPRVDVVDLVPIRAWADERLGDESVHEQPSGPALPIQAEALIPSVVNGKF